MKFPAKALLALSLAALCVFAQLQPREPRKKKKNEDKEPPTQVLPLPKDPPAAIAAETGKLVFHVSPLSDKGLLTQQTRDALNALLKLNRGAQMIKLRAFVAGTGDMRRIQTIASELFTDKKLPLPALTTIQVGALPMEGSQVEIEAISADKRVMNPDGLVFFAGQKGAERLQTAAASAGASEMLQVTCFTTPDGTAAVRESVAHTFPRAAVNIVQPLRSSAEPGSVCEGVGRRSQSSASSPQWAAVNPPKLVFSGLQMAFGNQPADLRLAFQRLDKGLESVGVSHADVVFSSSYLLSRAIEQPLAPVLSEFIPQTAAGTPLFVEGLPSLDATMGIEVIAASK